MKKTTNIFDRFNNTIGNHIEGKATDKDLIKIAYELDTYLLNHPHPHDCYSGGAFWDEDISNMIDAFIKFK